MRNFNADENQGAGEGEERGAEKRRPAVLSGCGPNPIQEELEETVSL